MVGAIPTYRIMRKQKLRKTNEYLKAGISILENKINELDDDNRALREENEKLKAEIDDAKSTLEIYQTVLNRVAKKEVVQIEINKAFKELLCRRK